MATCRFGGVRPASSGGEATQIVIDGAIGSAASRCSTQRRVTSDGLTLEGTVALLRIQDRTTHFRLFGGLPSEAVSRFHDQVAVANDHLSKLLSNIVCKQTIFD